MVDPEVLQMRIEIIKALADLKRQEIIELLRRESFMWHLSTVDTVTQDRCYSVDKAARELGFNPQYDLKTGLGEAVTWYRANGYL